MSTTTLIHDPTTNKPSFATLAADCEELGKQLGQGKDSLSKLFLKIAQWSFAGHIDVDPNKHGNGVDDAQKLAGAYTMGQSAGTIFDAKGGSGRVVASKVRTIVRFGMFAKGGTGEPMATINNFMAKRAAYRKDATMCKKLDDPSNSLLRLARAQLKRDHIVPASEFDTFLLKPQSETKTEEDWLEGTRKAAINAKKGKGGLSVDVATADRIIGQCTARLKAIAAARAPQGTQATPATV